MSTHEKSQRARFDGHCQRCGKRTHVSIVSYFNVDEICMDCSEKERAHPHFSKAQKAEEAACRRGEYNFPGIGLPADLGGGS